jgi:Domain of unknown function (DUF4919)
MLVAIAEAPVRAAPPDRYEALVKEAEAGKPVDLLELRMAYLKSPVRARVAKRSKDLLAWRTQMFAAMRGGTPQQVYDLAQKILDVLYIDLEAQKARRQACVKIKRPDCDKQKAVALGLLSSVVQSGDSKTCATGWEVVSVDEEYFVLRMRGLTFVSQGLAQEGATCDAMDVTDDEDKSSRTVYFRIDKMLEAATSAPRR